MPQVFRVVRCFSCEAFQVDQKKKVNKFVCKVCNSKQSVRKVCDADIEVLAQGTIHPRAILFVDSVLSITFYKFISFALMRVPWCPFSGWLLHSCHEDVCIMVSME